MFDICLGVVVVLLLLVCRFVGIICERKEREANDSLHRYLYPSYESNLIQLEITYYSFDDVVSYSHSSGESW